MKKLLSVGLVFGMLLSSAAISVHADNAGVFGGPSSVFTWVGSPQKADKAKLPKKVRVIPVGLGELRFIDPFIWVAKDRSEWAFTETDLNSFEPPLEETDRALRIAERLRDIKEEGITSYKRLTTLLWDLTEVYGVERLIGENEQQALNIYWNYLTRIAADCIEKTDTTHNSALEIIIQNFLKRVNNVKKLGYYTFEDLLNVSSFVDFMLFD